MFFFHPKILWNYAKQKEGIHIKEKSELILSLLILWKDNVLYIGRSKWVAFNSVSRKARIARNTDVNILRKERFIFVLHTAAIAEDRITISLSCCVQISDIKINIRSHTYIWYIYYTYKLDKPCFYQPQTKFLIASFALSCTRTKTNSLPCLLLVFFFLLMQHLRIDLK